MQFVFILEQVINGLLVGAYYLLIALGLSLIFSLGGMVNLAHGGFYAIGAYFAVILADRIGFAGALVASPVVVGCSAWSSSGSCSAAFIAGPALGLLLTFGLAMVIEQWLRIVFGAAPIPFSIPPVLKGQILLGDFIYPRYRLVILCWRPQPSSRRGSCFSARHSVAWCGRACRTLIVAALGISLTPYMTASSRSASGSPGLQACCWRRSAACILRWVRRS